MTLTLLDMRPVVGAIEIARMLGVSRQRAYQLVDRPGFPAPYAALAMGKVWRTDDVVTWAEGQGRDVREDDQ